MNESDSVVIQCLIVRFVNFVFTLQVTSICVINVDEIDGVAIHFLIVRVVNFFVTLQVTFICYKYL